MDCKKLHNNIIFFLEKELPVSEMNQVQEHLNSCNECAQFAEEMKFSLSILESDKITDENPFFYTRVKVKMENQSEVALEGKPVLVRILQPVVFSLILLLGIYGGIKLGQPTKTEISAKILAEEQMIPYLNEMAAEPIEAFLIQ